MPTLSVGSGICVYPLSGSHIFCLMLESKLAQAALELSARPTAVRDFARELVLSVSGGRDSMFLLWLFAGLRDLDLFSGALRVFHLDHGLRPDSADDLELVRRECARLDLPLFSERARVSDFARRSGLGIEAAGRRLRYRAIGRLLGAGPEQSFAVTAHHGDDFAESILLHLIRGGGPGALETMPERTRVFGVPVYRPLLSFSRLAIEQLVREFAVPYREDSSNQDQNFRRNRLRGIVMPALREEGLDAGALWRRFHNDRPASVLGPSEYLCLDRRLLGDPRGPKTLLDVAFRSLDLAPPAESLVAEFARQCAPGSGFRVHIKHQSFRIWSDRRGPIWIFRADARVFSSFIVESKGPQEFLIRFNGLERAYRTRPGQAPLQYRPGLRLVLPDGGRKRLKSFFQEQAVPAPVRSRLPLIGDRWTGLVETVCLSFWEQGRDRSFAASLSFQPDGST
ncbi:MAG: tRNA lysidine(34) synthetase TilS [Spirochaetales bacterium]|nr:tRNA lysidine(34) synthetase TilS [Spirochaetales bacterium]